MKVRTEADVERVRKLVADAIAGIVLVLPLDRIGPFIEVVLDSAGDAADGFRWALAELFRALTEGDPPARG